MNTTSPALPKRSFSWWRVALAVIVLGCVCTVTVKVAESWIADQSKRQNEQSILQWFELATPTPRTLDTRFVDADHDLVADAPKDPSKRRSPDVLVFSFVAGPTAEEELSDWKDFITHLSSVTGKPVETVVFASNGEQQAAMEKGTLHITAFNTGAVPAAVASSGFVPVCTFGHDDGSFGIKMQFIVPARSPIQKLEEVKNHSVTFTTPDSNSGCKAALALLQDHNLLPQRDYSWRFSNAHEESILGVAKGQYEIAPVASDLLQRAIASGLIQDDQIRIVYESERFPPATMGYAYDLTDPLAENIRKAFLEFDYRGTSLEKRFGESNTSKFVPLSYLQDYALIRRIDAAFRKPSRVTSE